MKTTLHITVSKARNKRVKKRIIDSVKDQVNVKVKKPDINSLQEIEEEYEHYYGE